jgi:hypothetical protein
MRNLQLAACLVVGCGVCAPAGAQIFQRAHGNQPSETALDIIDLRFCEYQTIGFRTTPAAGINAIHGVRYDSNGNVIWSNLYATTQGATVGYTVDEGRTGDLFFGCEAAFGGATNGKLIMRVNPAGAPTWSVLANGSPFAGSITAATPSLGVSTRELVTAKIASVNRQLNLGGVSRAGILTLLDTTGTLIFTRAFIPPGFTPAELDFAEVRGAATSGSAAGSMLVVGNIFDTTQQRYGVFAMRTDPTGFIVWQREYLHPNSALSITADGFSLADNGDILFSGRRGVGFPNQVSPTDLIVGRIDALTGAFRWAREVPNFLNGYQAVETTRNDSFLVAGTVRTGGTAVIQWASLIEFDQSGLLRQQMLYGPNAVGFTTQGQDVTRWDPWGGYALAGVTNDFGSGLLDIYFVKTYTNLVSGCRELPFVPPVTPITLIEKDPGVQPLLQDNWSFVTTPVTPYAIGTKTACFTPRCIGDLNGDGFVDDADFVLFADAYNALICPTDPRFECCPADFNGDGFVDDADFVLFSNAYNALLCP